MLDIFSCIYIVECSELGKSNNEKAIGGDLQLFAVV